MYKADSFPEYKSTIAFESSRTGFTIRAIVWGCAILSFLEPWSVALLVERGFYPQMISALSGLALAIRMLASSYGILRVFRQGKLKSHWFLAVVLFALLTFLSGLMHPSEQSLLSLFAQSFQLVGMASFLLYCLDASGVRTFFRTA